MTWGERRAPKAVHFMRRRVGGAPSPALKLFHFTPREGLTGGEGHPPQTPRQRSISRHGRVTWGEGRRAPVGHRHTSMWWPQPAAHTCMVVACACAHSYRHCLRTLTLRSRPAAHSRRQPRQQRPLARSEWQSAARRRSRRLCMCPSPPTAALRASSSVPSSDSMLVGSRCPTMRPSTYTMVTSRQQRSASPLLAAQRLALPIANLFVDAMGEKARVRFFLWELPTLLVAARASISRRGRGGGSGRGTLPPQLRSSPFRRRATLPAARRRRPFRGGSHPPLTPPSDMGEFGYTKRGG